jgi:hypothetical protein
MEDHVGALEQGSMLGEFRKIRHPQNVEFYEIREMSFQESRTCEI